MFFVFDSIPDWYNTQEMCGKVVSEDIFLIVYCADDSLAQLILIPDCFVTSRMIKKKLFTALHADENAYFMKILIVLYLIVMKWVFLILILIVLILIRVLMGIILILLFWSDFWLGILNLKNAKKLKNISEELMTIAWHPKRSWDWYLAEDENKETEPIFTE